MHPIPMESEKKACPIASRKTVDFTFFISGLNKKANPSDDPGRVTARIPKIMRSRKSIGIKILDDFSTPLFTPDNVNKAVKIMKIVVNRVCFK